MVLPTMSTPIDWSTSAVTIEPWTTLSCTLTVLALEMPPSSTTWDNAR